MQHVVFFLKIGGGYVIPDKSFATETQLARQVGCCFFFLLSWLLWAMG